MKSLKLFKAGVGVLMNLGGKLYIRFGGSTNLCMREI